MTDLRSGSAGQESQGAGKQADEGIHYGVQAGEGGVKPKESQVKGRRMGHSANKQWTEVRSNNRSPGGNGFLMVCKFNEEVGLLQERTRPTLPRKAASALPLPRALVSARPHSVPLENPNYTHLVFTLSSSSSRTVGLL